MVAIDVTILMLFLRPDSGRPLDVGGKPVAHPKERVEHLVAELSSAGTQVIVPTPALAEVLVRAEPAAIPEIVQRFQKSSAFRLEAFDARAAVELAQMSRMPGGKSKRGDSAATWAKLKYDRQIVAIAKVNRATTIYSDDRDIRRYAHTANIAVVGIADLTLPPETAQMALDLKHRADAE